MTFLINPFVFAKAEPSAYRDTVLADNPYLYWRLGESSGTTAQDASGNSRDGTYSGPTLGATSLLTGDADTCADFDGTNDVVSISDADLGLTTLESFSAEAWFNADTVTGNRLIIGRVRNALGQQWMLRIDNGTLIFYTRSGGGWRSLNCGSVSTGTTYHAVVVVNVTGSGTRTAYLNGEQAASASGNLPDTAGGVGFSVGNWEIGGVGTEWFDGRIDEPALYRSILSPERVAAHYEAGSGESL